MLFVKNSPLQELFVYEPMKKQAKLFDSSLSRKPVIASTTNLESGPRFADICENLILTLVSIEEIPVL